MVLHAQPADEAAKKADSATFAIASPAMSYSSGPLRNPFPPIADYAFLSDCETTCLISPAGAVEWLCVPRPDSPSVFGAILDRSAGHFRLGPYGVSVPSARRYLPGSLIMETTWQTHTGWLIVRDALVMGPWHDLERRSRTHRRTPMDWDAEHILLRTIRCVSGTAELLMSCEPAFDYHRVGATWEYSADGYGEASAAQQWNVRKIIADIGDRRIWNASFLEDLFVGRHFHWLFHIDKFHLHFMGAAKERSALATRDASGPQTGGMGKRQSLAVVGIKGLNFEGCTVGLRKQAHAAVRHRAVHIHQDQSN